MERGTAAYALAVARRGFTVGRYLEQYDETASRDPMRAAMTVMGWVREDWRGLFAELRAERPIFVTPAFALVTKFADVTEVLGREKTFTVRPTASSLDAALGSGFMLARDATPMHWRERGLMQLMLAPEDVPAVRELAGRAADEALDAASDSSAAGPIDVIGDVFRPVASRVCEEYFGYRGVPPAKLSSWVRAIIKDCYANPAHDSAIRAASVEAGAELMNYLRTELARRRASTEPGDKPCDDLFGRLARASIPAECGIDDERIAVNMAGLPLGFVESAPAAMALAARQLLARPDILAAAARAAASSDPAEFDPYVWEALRLDTFFRLMPPRLCELDHLLAAGTPRATVIPAGTIVFPALASAMYDEDVVPEPEAFRLNRPEHVHIHFGTGHAHNCLGVHPARVIVAETLRRLLRRGIRQSPEDDIVFDAIFPDRYLIQLSLIQLSPIQLNPLELNA